MSKPLSVATCPLSWGWDPAAASPDNGAGVGIPGKPVPVPILCFPHCFSCRWKCSAPVWCLPGNIYREDPEPSPRQTQPKLCWAPPKSRLSRSSPVPAAPGLLRSLSPSTPPVSRAGGAISTSGLLESPAVGCGHLGGRIWERNGMRSGLEPPTLCNSFKRDFPSQ